MSDDDVTEMRRDFRKDKKGEGNPKELADKWGVVLLPKVLIKVSVTAMQFHVPWGTAYIRLKEMNKL